jgi:retron-type reverse transcriptase
VKRHGQLWEKETSFANLVRAADAVRKGKRHRPNVARFDFDLGKELCRLQDELRCHTYVPGEYRSFLIYEPKQRLISAAPYRDRIIQHALVRVLDPILEPTFIFDSYACGRGMGDARGRGPLHRLRPPAPLCAQVRRPQVFSVH